MQSNPTSLTKTDQELAWQTLAEFSLPSQPGSDHLAREQVTVALQALNLSPVAMERLKIAVAEATLNAIEHGNRFQPDLPVTIRVLTSAKMITVSITDQGSEPIPEPESPDLATKVAGQESLRGWGFFLIEKMMDDFRISSDEAHHHTIELFLYLEGGDKDEVG